MTGYEIPPRPAAKLVGGGRRAEDRAEGGKGGGREPFNVHRDVIKDEGGGRRDRFTYC